MASVSNDLLWALTRQNNRFLEKRRQAGGVQFSRDPLSAGGVHSYKQSGLANDKAVGVTVNANGQIQLLTKSAKNANKPAKAVSVTTFKKHVSGRRVAAAVSKAATNYRDDVRNAAVLKASALARTANKPKKVFAAKTNGRR
uniref:ARAD1A15092p n=1 Tax=Blastobotrys adeninivorans TaxID=409370 RepID=A0A060SYD3_BLAAD